MVSGDPPLAHALSSSLRRSGLHAVPKVRTRPPAD